MTHQVRKVLHPTHPYQVYQQTRPGVCFIVSSHKTRRGAESCARKLNDRKVKKEVSCLQLPLT